MTIARKGIVKFFDSITLESILHVTKFSCNLLTISRLTTNTNCSIKCFPSSCVFQDLSSERKIDNARESEGLYNFVTANVSDQCQITNCNPTSIPRNNDFLLWHFNHSFQYLRQLFPFFVQNKEFLYLRCEMYELAKHYRTSFSKPKYTFSILLPLFTVMYGDRLETQILHIQNDLSHLLMITLVCVR